ncbi:MAG: hypothetical protein K8U57_14185 [Planctomycetes bacterium]|nr:hypothetical protein [Planctomycetota bacterium]
MKTTHTESTVTLGAAALVVHEMTGMKPTRATLWNWARHGLRTNGTWLKLETTQAGGFLLTTRADLARFLKATGKLKATQTEQKCEEIAV